MIKSYDKYGQQLKSCRINFSTLLKLYGCNEWFWFMYISSVIISIMNWNNIVNEKLDFELKQRNTVCILTTSKLLHGRRVLLNKPVSIPWLIILPSYKTNIRVIFCRYLKMFRVTDQKLALPIGIWFISTYVILI